MSVIARGVFVGLCLRARLVVGMVCVFACAGVVGLVCAAPVVAAAPGKPMIAHQQVEATTDSAKAEAQIDPEGLETSCVFEYVSETQFAAHEWAEGREQPCTEALGSGATARLAVAQISELTIETAYRYRFIASNGDGVVESPEATFVTFGIEAFALEPLESLGKPFAQAGGHPYALVTNIAFDSNPVEIAIEGGMHTAGDAVANTKDIEVALPQGLVGDPTAAPQCTQYDAEHFKCSPDAQVGTIEVIEGEYPSKPFVKPLFNLVPPRGVAARFSARLNNVANAFINASVRSGSDYGIDAGSLDLPSLLGLKAVKVTFWGDPAGPSHTPERACLTADGSYDLGCSSTSPERPFLSLPSACTGSSGTVLEADAYEQPGVFVRSVASIPELTGCAREPFEPSLQASSTTARGDSPTGLDLDVHVPQDEAPEGIATADLRDATVTLPAGLVVNPSSAEGLQACPESDVGFEGFKELNPTGESGVMTAQLTPGAAECPNASTLGTVKIHTPLLDHPLEGSMYLATPHENPFHALLALYLAVYDPISGVVIKLPGKVEANHATGQLTAIFDQNPQLPFEDLEVDLFAGARASLTTPLQCGSYTTTSLLEPWSHKGAEGEEGTPDATPSSDPFQITESCAAQEGEAQNSPMFEAGPVNPIAGSYSPFALKLSREDGSQRFGALNVTLPPGMLGKVAGTEQCPQADIEKAESHNNEGEGALEQSSPSCPTGSRVGVVYVGAGSGAPYYVSGQAYFAGPYEGAPFSLVIVTPAIAGPFDLGAVVVRAGLYINPNTAQVTVKSDPLPAILDGIPLDIRAINVEINKHEFTLNPTNCEAMSVTGEEKSTASHIASLSHTVKAEGCGNLPFHPSFTASTQGKTSKANGASLKVNVASSGVGQANIAKVDLTIPKLMPARLTTLQQACTESQFNANPAGCPAASDIGSAIVHTPILASPLSGPAYIVSHGGAAFPDVEIVLQGEGVELVLDGKTQIKDGITYSKFETVPDAPFTSFEFNAPEGPHSIFTTENPGKTNLCATSTTKTVTVKKKETKRIHGKRKKVTVKVKKTEKVAQALTIPTTLVAQNGVTITQNTPVTVTECAKKTTTAKSGKKKPNNTKHKQRRKKKKKK